MSATPPAKFRQPRRLLAVLAACQMAPVFAGSLYNAGEFQPLIGDHRAHKVGDSVVVLVYESATATNKADTTTTKSSAVALSATDSHTDLSGKVNSDNDSSGGGTESRSDEVVAQVSATVVDILPGGDFVIRGHQHIALNNETQDISVEGRVRPMDIATNNTVISTRVADAKIEFKGEGLLSAREKPGLVSQFINWLF